MVRFKQKIKEILFILFKEQILNSVPSIKHIQTEHHVKEYVQLNSVIKLSFEATPFMYEKALKQDMFKELEKYIEVNKDSIISELPNYNESSRNIILTLYVGKNG